MCFTLNNGGWFGNKPILSAWFGNTKFYPTSSANYIVLASTGATVQSGQSYSTITVSSASTTAWTVESSVAWIAVTKQSSTSARYDYLENPDFESRTGYIYFKIDGTTYATYTVSQAAQVPYISLYPASFTIDDYGQSGKTYVTTNMPSWSAYSNQTWLTLEINGNTAITWTASKSYEESTRRAFITASGYGVSAYTQVDQLPGYVLRFMGSSTQTISSAATTVTITVKSQYQGNTIAATCAVGRDDLGVTFVSSGQTDVGYYFVYHVPQRTAQSTGMTAFAITQTASQMVIGYQLTQEAGAAPVVPSGVTEYATYGDWILGTITTATNTGPGNAYDVKGIAIVNNSAITKDYTAHVSGTYNYGVPSSAFTWNDETKAIASGATITVGSTTYNGTWLRTPTLNQGIHQVTDFRVLADS